MTRRFTVLEHDHPFLHWDFLLEREQDLRTWRLLAEPAPPLAPGVTLPAEELPAHRLLYLDYEGPVSGDRGRVTQWDTGTCTAAEETDDLVRLELHGRRLDGPFVLRRDANGGWTFQRESD